MRFRNIYPFVRYIVVLLSCWCCVNVSAQDLQQFSEIRTAKEKGQHILLIFSGSDWCMPCIRLKKEVLDKPEFKKSLGESFKIINADFPQRSKLEKHTLKRNEALAEAYNQEGAFPRVVLLSPDLAESFVINHAHFDVIQFTRDILETSREVTHMVYDYSSVMMGSSFKFTLVDSIDSRRIGGLMRQCVQEVQRIENLISEWIPSSEISRVNNLAGTEGAHISSEVYELIRRSQILSRLTQGGFDISFLGFGDHWQFNGQTSLPPSEKSIAAALEHVGFEKIALLDSFQVVLPKGMSIGFGGIGKGYAADQVKKLMAKAGIADGVINAGGDLIAWGKPPDADFWKIAIADPRNPDEILCWIPINDGAVATSGDYEKFLIMNGQRYAHIIDPRTGYPVTGITSVSVISTSAELSDALATAIFVLGLETGMDLIEQLPHVECLIIDAENKLHFSSKLKFISNSRT